MSPQTVALTRNPVHDHIFSWKMENVSKFTEPLIGPIFSPIPFCEKKFHFEVRLQEFDQNSATECLLEVLLHVDEETPAVEVPQPNSVFNFSQLIQNENTRFGSLPKSLNLGQPRRLFREAEIGQPKTQAFNCSCEITLSNTAGKILASAKTQFMNVKHNDSLVKRVLFTSLKKDLQGHAFLDLAEDKLIMKATFSISGYDTQSNVCSSMLTTLPVSHCAFLKDLKTMFETGYAHDVIFSVEGKTIPAHKSIVGIRSPVLAKMFPQDMKNSQTITIKDECFDVFNVFLLFLYTSDIVDKNWETTIALFSLAVKFQVQSLRRECCTMLTEGISMSSFYRILTLADQHGDVELKKTAKNFCRSNFDRVIETGEWANLLEFNPVLASYVMKSVRTLDPPVPPEAKKMCMRD